MAKEKIELIGFCVGIVFIGIVQLGNIIQSRKEVSNRNAC